MEQFVSKLPKAELHLHIEGTLQPQLLLKLAQKNKIPIKYKDIEEIRRAYKFDCLQSFLDIYYEGMNVLQTKQDFYDLAADYVKNCRKNNVVHAEIFFDPQGHTHRGVNFQTMFTGIYQALVDGQKEGNFSFSLIMCFLRHLSEQDAFKTLEQALPFKDKIQGVGLDSTEVGNPPSKHKNVFAKAKEHGLRLVAHAGQQAPASWIKQALQVLKIQRVDHGVKCIQDKQLMQFLADNKIGLTVCPLSNLKLQGVKKLQDHSLKTIMDNGILATINSDDPAYFDGYVNANFIESAKAFNLSQKQLATLAKNSFAISFLPEEKKEYWINIINEMI